MKIDATILNGNDMHHAHHGKKRPHLLCALIIAAFVLFAPSLLKFDPLNARPTLSEYLADGCVLYMYPDIDRVSEPSVLWFHDGKVTYSHRLGLSYGDIPNMTDDEVISALNGAKTGTFESPYIVSVQSDDTGKYAAFEEVCFLSDIGGIGTIFFTSSQFDDFPIYDRTFQTTNALFAEGTEYVFGRWSDIDYGCIISVNGRFRLDRLDRDDPYTDMDREGVEKAIMQIKQEKEMQQR